LHLGDLSFKEAEQAAATSGGGAGKWDEAPPVPKDLASQQALEHAAELLGVDPVQMLQCLTTRTRQTPEGGCCGMLAAQQGLQGCKSRMERPRLVLL
jgi:hypothetical protein